MATESSVASQDSQVCQVVVVESSVGDVTAVTSFGPQAAVNTPRAARLDAREFSSAASTIIADAEEFFKIIDLRLQYEPESFRQTDWLITAGLPSKSRQKVEADIALVAMLGAADTTFDSSTDAPTTSSASRAFRRLESVTAASAGAPSLLLRSSRVMASE